MSNPSVGQSASTPIWHSDLVKAYEISQKNNTAILVRAGAEWCVWCKRLDAEIDTDEVKAELTKWTLVYLDIDANPADAQKLGIGSIPAFRALKVDGTRLGSVDGFLESSRLLEWLRSHGSLEEPLAKDLLEAKPPDILGVVKLVREFNQRDPRRREAVIRRLAPHPAVAAASVLDAFERGDLSIRLTALELLTRWNAPIGGLDPWRPDSITRERIGMLKDWAREAAASSRVEPPSIDEARLDIDRLCRAVGRAEQDAILRGLDVYGTTIFPEVYRLLKESSDETRSILTVLRYRLAASDSLRLSQPGMFFALASTDLSERRSAMQQLTKVAKTPDGPLLLELFGSSDPVLRESSLRALRKLSGTRALDSLITLLNDPDPNVRAAVLKQLAEDPTPRLMPALAEFLDRETDLDLLVHAVRVLRATRSAAAVKELLGLLSHESWRVRAEAAEAISETLRGGFRYPGSFAITSEDRGDKISEGLRSEAYVALIHLLDDGDGFVVSRAVQGLDHVDLVAAVEPLIRTIESHPNLAADVVKILANSEPLRKLALPHLETFTQHQIAQVRAAAITGICNIGLPPGAHTKVVEGLADEDREVRLAAAQGLLRMMDTARPQGYAAMDEESVGRLKGLGYISGPQQVIEIDSGDESSQVENSELNEADWLIKYRSGKIRPDWMEETVPPLRAMLTSADLAERVNGAIPLVGLGRDVESLPILVEAIGQDRALFPAAVKALPWLPWDERRGFYQQLLLLKPSKNELAELAQGLSAIRDVRAAELLWSLIVHPETDSTLRREIDRALRRLYLGDQMWDMSNVLVSDKKVAVADAERIIVSGSDEQQQLALRLLLAVDKKRAQELAEELMAKPEIEAPLFETALEVQFRSLPKEQSKQLAVRMLSDSNPKAQKLGLVFLAVGPDGFWGMNDFDPIHIPEVFVSGIPFEENTANAPELPKLPKELTREALDKFFDLESEEAVYAAFLAVLLNDRSKIDQLIDVWRSEGRKKDTWTRMVYQAISVTDDDRFASTLEEIYRTFSEDDYRLRDFYWTIRSMDGPNVRSLREKIREEVGMERLR